MNIRPIRLAGIAPALLLLFAALPAARAGDGLSIAAPETLWPRWQARIAVQAASVSPLVTSSLFDNSGAQRGVQGGALFGDYYFARPSFGAFRASGGVVSGSLAGLPLASATAGGLVGLSLNAGNGLRPALAGTNDAASALPYLGVGFTGAAGHGGLSISADLGLVAERASAVPGVGRAVFGNQALDGAVRELRLSPLLQLGVRYAF